MENEKNERKKKIIWKIVINVLTITTAVSLLFCLYSVFIISGIETEIRYIAMGALFLVNLLILIALRRITRKKKIISYIIYIVILAILTVGQGYLGYFLFKTYSSIDNINKDNITYSTNIVVLKDSKILDADALSGKKIGIVVDETSIDGYIIGMEIVKELKLNDSATIVEYDNISNLIGDLYDNKVEAAIVSNNYVSMLKSLDRFEKIADEVRQIYKKEKTLTKNEIAKITGSEVINLNTSNSITEPFSILVMGIDSEGVSLAQNATGNGDALMLVTFNPKTLNATILSIPRDTYVVIPCLGNIENKITHAAWGGESCVIKSVQNLTGLNIDYYVKINFKGVVNLVDTLGGITVNVPDSLDGVCEQNSDRAFGDYQQCFTAGTQVLNGEQALAMARHRKTLLTGDFARGLNQQLVVQGILNQLKTVRSANQALKILDAISISMDTNFTTKQLLSFYDIAKNLFETSSTSNLINMQQLYLTGAGQMIYDERANMVMYDFIVNKCSLADVVSVMNKNLGKETVGWTKQMDFDIEDPFSMKIIGEDASCRTSTYTLLPSVEGKGEAEAIAILQGYGLSVNVEYTSDTSRGVGIVISQNFPDGKRLDKLNPKAATILVTKAEVVKEEDSTNGTCSDDSYTSKLTCKAADETWTENDDEEETPTEPTEPSVPEEPSESEQTSSCSDSQYTTKEDCENADETWTE